MDVLLFLAGVAVTALVFWLQKRSSEKSETSLKSKISDGGDATQLRIDQLELIILETVQKLGLPENEKKELLSVFDESGYEDILQEIDGEGSLKIHGTDGCDELTKRFLFHVMKNMLYMPFPKYKHFIYWLSSKGYLIPEEKIFSSKLAYDKARGAMEQKKRKRGGIMVWQIDASSFFTSTAPYK